MAKRKCSFLSEMLGEDSYQRYSDIARVVAGAGTLVLLLLYVLSSYFHSGIVNFFVKLTNGTSLLFIAYILAIILLLDIRVEMEEAEKNWWTDKNEKTPKPLKYKLTIVWTIILSILGVVAIYQSNRYRNQYNFECSTFLVDRQSHIYHLDWNDDCDVANEAEELEEVYGYQLDESYSFCEGCKDLQDEMDSEYTGKLRPD